MSRKNVDISKLDLSVVGDRIAYIRLSKGLTMEDFASKVGLTKGNISNFEKHKYEPSYKVLVAIYKQFGVDSNWLLTGRGSPFKKYNRDIDNFAVQEIDTNYGDSPRPNNVIESEHFEIVKNFKDKARAKNANLDLLKIEQIDRDVYLEVIGYIHGVANGLKKALDGQLYAGADRRRQNRRQIDNKNEVPSDGDRRSGTDRRKAASGDH